MRTALVVDDHPENIYLLRCLDPAFIAPEPVAARP